MARTYDLEPFDLDFFDTAPISYRIDINIPVSPQRAWAELTRQNTLDWCKAIKSIEFTSAAPYGLGTTRQASLAPGYVTLSEVFFDWTEDAENSSYHNAFRVAKVNVPGMRRFGEYTEVTPAAVGSRLVWAFALELGPSSRALNAFSNPASVPVFKSIESDTLRHFAHLTPQA
ncbi:SRPBCC family protein [Gordonia sp. L191]|uniref:SRPBCC family protein n=1 Tax=Gordonia sp. L191 TaxID=2982699 RepID=UPI0024BFD001|nr:SRPBCC family protein [Gordonia sp. L191]WHU45524.1 SRPBCC family protein [Gordonia sp. L191]